MEPSPQNMAGANPAAALAGQRIVFVLDHFDFDGPVRQALLLAGHLQQVHGADVHIWALRPRAPRVTAGSSATSAASPEALPGRGADECAARGLPWRVVPGQVWESYQGRRLLSLVRLMRELRALRPRIILPYVTTACLACGLGWRFTGAQLCVWNQRDEGAGLEGNWPLKWLAIRATPLIVSNSAHAAELLCVRFGARRQRVHVVRNAVPLSPALPDRAAQRQRLGIPADALAAGMVANLTARKDHATLLRAWRAVMDAAPPGPPPQLLLAGRLDDTAPGLQQLAADLGIAPHVKFLGPVADIPGLLAALDLGVHSSWLEGCPNGVLEAMAGGLAVAGTDIPGIREALGPEGLPFLAPPRAAPALGQCILRLLGDAALRRQLGAHYRQRISDHFNPAHMCARMTQLIVAGLDRAPAAPRPAR